MPADVLGIVCAIFLMATMVFTLITQIDENIKAKHALKDDESETQAIFESKAEFRAAMAKDEADDYITKTPTQGVFEQPRFETSISDYVIETNRILTPNDLRRISGVTDIRLDPPNTGWMKR